MLKLPEKFLRRHVVTTIPLFQNMMCPSAVRDTPVWEKSGPRTTTRMKLQVGTPGQAGEAVRGIEPDTGQSKIAEPAGLRVGMPTARMSLCDRAVRGAAGATGTVAFTTEEMATEIFEESEAIMKEFGAIPGRMVESGVAHGTILPTMIAVRALHGARPEEILCGVVGDTSLEMKEVHSRTMSTAARKAEIRGLQRNCPSQPSVAVMPMMSVPQRDLTSDK